MIRSWMLPHITKGLLTYVPPLNALRQRRRATGGTGSARYCYAVWMRHMVLLQRHGFSVKEAAVGELGPGDSIGTGLAAVLCGARRYVGCDAVTYSALPDLTGLLNDLQALLSGAAAIPDH